LLLDQTPAGYLNLVTGGDIAAPVVELREAGSLVAMKNLGPISYEPVWLKFGMGMSSDVYNWINMALLGTAPRKNASIVAFDHQFNPRTRRLFQNAILSEVTFPALDASSKDPALLTIKLEANAIDLDRNPSAIAVPTQARKLSWRRSDFRLEIPGLDCSRVSQIEMFTVTRETMTITDAGGFSALVEGPRLWYSNLRVALRSAATWYDWFDDFVIGGNQGTAQEKAGTLTYYKPDLATELARVEFQNLGICRLTEEDTNESVPRVVAELYCERMTFARA
jgi:phage tail-like protein